MTTLLHALLAAGICYALYAGCILCYRLFFTSSYDDYPIKRYGKSKTKKQSQGRTDPDVSCNQLTSIEDWQHYPDTTT
jgi:hypothetical protein